ncbi:MAG: cobalamin-dependent protein [Candidatus Marinimicrobia bacterium]|nr:cobalamin B12-binding domain-containing protein [FCB group bacterium]MBL7023833.1 cobalamin-dependent protein [Candidatus Neomarinimicrobiota bacterium]
MDNILARLGHMVAVGKINKNTPRPADMIGMDGADELAAQAVKLGIAPNEILNKGLLLGMSVIGEKFSRGEAFIANMLISAQAMNAAMEHLRPFFESGEIKSTGTLVLGTVRGDLHDIGKNLVKMILKGDGWDVIDLGTDVSADEFVTAVDANPQALVGLSALLTTTMLNMEEVIMALKNRNPKTRVFIGGAPVSQMFSEEIGADGYFRDPHSFARSLRTR